MSGREERVAKNESTARDINEQVDGARDDGPRGSAVPMVCECGYESCERVVMVTPREYSELRRDARQFAVAHDHVIADVEQVVAGDDRYAVVLKREGTPAKVATELDPRG